MSLQEDTSFEEIMLNIDNDVTELIESRGILVNEVKMVIHDAESSGIKLYNPDSDQFLASKRIADVSYFVVYQTAADSAFEVTTAYCCKSEIMED